MNSYKIYLDNWVIYPFYYTKDKRHKEVKECFERDLEF